MSDQDNSSETSTLDMKTEENFNKILDAISDMRQSFTHQFEGLGKRVEHIEKKVENIEKKVEHIETEQMEIKKKVEHIEIEQANMHKYMDNQFEAIRLGIEKNYNQFDRIDAQISENRSVIFSTKALVGELKEKVYLLTRETKQPI